MDKIVIGIFYSILAGTVIAMQNVFNARISEKIGMWETTVVVHVVGLVFAFIMAYIFGNNSYEGIKDVNKLYLFAGALGVIIIFSITTGVTTLGASFSISLMVISQLSFATVIDTFGLFGSDKIPFDLTKFMGIAIMIIGVIVFKSKG